MIRGIDHITLIVADLAATQHFYESVLGMEKLDRPAFDFEGLWMAVPGIQLHFILQNDLTGPAGLQHRAGGRPSRHLHFAFQVDDFAAACARIEQAEVRILDGPKSRPDGIRQLFIADPDDYVLELCDAVVIE